MNKPKIYVLLTAILIVAVCLTGIAAADDAGYTEYNGKMCVDNCLYLKCDLSTQEGTALAGQVTILTNHSDISPGLLMIETPAGMTVSEAVTYFENLPGAEYAEPNYVIQVPQDDAVPAEEPVLMFSSSSSDDTSPNDPRFGEQWALQKMNVPEAWTYTTGSDKIVVAVIDTGVNYNHLDIIDNMWTNSEEIPDNGIDDDKNGYVDDYYGYNFGDNTDDPADNLGHGTHVAGIIGAVGNNGIGISGVSQKVSIMALRVSDSQGNMGLESIINAIKYAVDMDADIINMSLAGYLDNPEYSAAIKYACEKGVPVVAGSGNDIEDTDVSRSYPATFEYPNVISVSALDKTDSLAVYSNYGAFSVDVAAPGGGMPYDLLSLSNTDNNGYVMMSGTSMATPMVSGLAALLLVKNPELTAVDLKCIIMATVTTDSNLEGKVVTGGRVNAGDAMKNAVHNKYHLVTFNSSVKKYGTETMTEIGSQVVESGTLLTEPSDPVNHFMKFDGWYTESGTKWDFTTSVTEDLKLYAKWVDDTSLLIDTSWYEGHEEDSEYHISTASQLLGLSKIVYDAPFDMYNPATYAFSGKTVTLDNDVSLAGINWIPIGVDSNNLFAGVFDGAGHTISGLSVNLPKENNVGLFGSCTDSVINLTLEASKITGYNNVGALCGVGNHMKNVTVTVDTVTGHNNVGGLMGYRPSEEDTTDDSDITVTVNRVNAVSVLSDGYGLTAIGAGGAIGYGVANNITVKAGEIYAYPLDNGGVNVGGAFGYAPKSFRNVSVNVSSITGNIAVGGIAGRCDGNISNCSAVVGSLNANKGGGAVGRYYMTDVSQTAAEGGNTVKDIFVSVNGNASGGAIGFVQCSDKSAIYKLTIENVLVTGNLICEKSCGGIIGCIGDSQVDATCTVLTKNCVSLLKKIGNSAEYYNKCGRIYGIVEDKNASVNVENSYGWEGTVNSQGALFDSSDVKNGSDVLTYEVWDNQSFFEKLGWNFNGLWQMNSGNDNFKLPVLQNTRSTDTLNASYLLKHTVHFNANGGNGTMDDQVFTDSVPQNLKKNTFTNGDGYTFEGWAESSSGIKSYDDEKSYPARKSATLYAVWAFSKDVENKDGTEAAINDTTDFGSVDSVTFVDAPGNDVKLVYTKNSSVSTSGLEGTQIGSVFEINVKKGDVEVTSGLNTKVSFSVKKSELDEDQVQNVKLAHRTSENQWEYLATTNTSVDENYRFTAGVTGFSPFAVVIKADEPEKSSSSVTAFSGEKDGSDFTFKKAVVITKATIPGASYATVINTSGSGWYTCSLSTDGTNGTVYFQVPLDVIDIKGYTVNDVSLLGCRTTYLTSEGGYAKYSAVINGAGSYTIDFEKDAAQKAVETKPVTETKTLETPVTTTPVTTETTPVKTAAKSPVPVLGILAGLGIAGVLVMRRH